MSHNSFQLPISFFLPCSCLFTLLLSLASLFIIFIHCSFMLLLHFACKACLHSSTSLYTSPAFSPLMKSLWKSFSCDVKERVPCCPTSGGSWVPCALLVFRKSVVYFLFHHLVLPPHHCASVLQLFLTGGRIKPASVFDDRAF